MENMIIVAGLLGIGIFGFFVIKHMDHFTSERKRKKGRIRVAFDSSTLIKGMEEKMKEYEADENNPELFWYAGTQEEVMDMLQSDHVDFAVCLDTVLAQSHTEYHVAKLLLNPAAVDSEYQGMKIEPAQMQNVAVSILWKRKLLPKDMHKFLHEAGVVMEGEK